MTNAWSLAASILNGTFDKDYPIMKKKEVDEKTGLWKEPDPVEHSDYYDYNRNDPDRENPFTDPADRERAEKVVKNTSDQRDLDGLKKWVGLSGHLVHLGHHLNLDLLKRKIIQPMTMSLQVNEKQKWYKPQKNHQYKYHEEEILKILKSMFLQHIKDTIQEQNMSSVKCKPLT